MSSSYGHAIARIGDLSSSKAFHHTYTEREACQVPHWDRVRYPDVLVWRPSCSGRDCPEKPEFVTRYLYVTGRAGRVTDRIQYCCQKHGEAFAKKHGLTFPTSAPIEEPLRNAPAAVRGPDGQVAEAVNQPAASADEPAAPSPVKAGAL